MSNLPATSHRIHGPALWAILDAKRSAEGLSWRGVARATGCSTGSLFTRLRRDDVGLHSHALVSLLVWLGRDAQIRDLITEATPPGAAGPAGPSAVDKLAAALSEASVSEVQQAFRRVGARIQFDVTDEQEPTP